MVLFSEHFIEAPGRFYPTVDDNTYLVYDPESAPHPVRTLCKFLKKSRPTVDTSVNYNEPSSKFYHTFSLEHATIQSVRYCPKSKSESTLCTGSTHDKTHASTLSKDDGCSRVLVKKRPKPQPQRKPQSQVPVQQTKRTDGRPNVLVKKRPQTTPKPQPPVQRKKKIKATYSCEKPYETTLTSSLLSLVTHSSKEIWKDAEITGEYISFLPSLKETKDKQEIFRRQGVVSGYPKRTLPYWEDAIEAAVRERKKAESLWRRLGRMRKSS